MVSHNDDTLPTWSVPVPELVWLPLSAGMVKESVATSVGNSYCESIGILNFPKDQNLCHKWTTQVKRTRDKWEPSKTSVLCRAPST